MRRAGNPPAFNYLTRSITDCRNQQELVCLRPFVQFSFGFRKGVVKITISRIVLAMNHNVIPTVLFEDCILVHRDPVLPGLVAIKRILHLPRDFGPQ